MGVGFRSMRAGEEEAVAAMIRQLPKDLGHDALPLVTGESLRGASDFVKVLVADDSGLLLGCCVWMPVYSTWRGCKGIYITDLYVMAHARGKRVGERLIRQLCREAQKIDARYMRLEVDIENPRATQFYERLGFKQKTDQFNCFLEADELELLAGEKP
jgi:ribosomal protein S18 acetylase RimI-like enzyme